MKKKNTLLVAIILLFTLAIVGCGKGDEASEEKVIHLGFNPGPYIDQFKLGIEPQLLEKGYTIEYSDFSDGIQPNLAVANGEIDANIFQHAFYMESINEEENIDLVGVVQVPTPPMGLYSSVHESLEGKEGLVVAMPSDPINMARALKILEKIGWIVLSEDTDPLRVTAQDILENPFNIEIRPMDSAQGPRALEDVDYVAIQGNFAVSSGLDLTSALEQETMDSPYINVVAVKEENQDKQFVKDLIDAYHSQQFQEAILAEEQFDGYVLPDYFNE